MKKGRLLESVTGTALARSLLLLAAIGSVWRAVGMVPFDVRLDTVVKEKMEEEQIPVFAVGVVSDGQVKVAKTYRAAKHEDEFEPCISSEEFTSAAVLLLARQGMIELDLSPADYLTERPRAFSDTSIRSLLSGSSLLSTLAPRSVPGAERISKTAGTSMLPLERREPVVPGRAAHVGSDSEGSCILQRLIEQVTRQDYSDFVKATVLRPAGMENTEFVQVPSANPEKIEDSAGKLECLRTPWLARTTLRDLLLWEKALWQDKRLKREAIELMLEPRAPLGTEEAASGFANPIPSLKIQPVAIPVRSNTQGNVSIYRAGDRKLSIVVASSAGTGSSRELAEQLATLWLQATARGPLKTALPEKRDNLVISELPESFREPAQRAGF